MTVYAELFKRKNGVYPKQAILYFLNELDVNPVPTKRPLRAVHTVNFNQGNVDRALSEFDATADEIIQCNTQNTWPMPLMVPDKERSEEHTSELQSLMRISYAVFFLKKTKNNTSNAQI